VQIALDDELNVSVYPDIIPRVAFYDTGHIGIRLPVVLDAADIGIALPYKWSHWLHEITQEEEAQFKHEFDAETGEETQTYTGTVTYTVITIAHTLFEDAAGGYIGIAPAAITGVPGGWATPLVATDHASLITAIGLNTAGNNRVVRVTQNINQTGTIRISGNRQVIIASDHTNVTTHVRDPIHGAPFAINHTGVVSSGRHFVVYQHATLILSNIILDGMADQALPLTARTHRGGINLSGGVASNVPGHLVMHNSILRRNHNGMAGSQGGALQLHLGSNFTMYSGSLEYNSAVGNGGAIGMLGAGQGNIVIHSGSIINNEAADWGGGINFWSSGTPISYLWLTGTGETIISGNTSGSDGGGIRIIQGGNIRIGSMLVGNTPVIGSAAIIIENNTSNTASGVLGAGGGASTSPAESQQLMEEM